MSQKPKFQVGDIVELDSSTGFNEDWENKHLHYGVNYEVIEVFFTSDVRVKGVPGLSLSPKRFKLAKKVLPFGQDPDKKYTFRGNAARLVCTDRKSPNMYLWLYNDGANEQVISSNAKGITGLTYDNIEEVQETDWTKVEVDTLIWVKVDGVVYYTPRYFEKFEGNKVYFFPGGATSFTTVSTSTYSKTPQEVFLEKPIV